jgi:hypothetical protein
MTTVPYAKLRVSLNGGAIQTGGIEADYGDVVQLSAEHVATVDSFQWEIWEFPDGFTCPAGWSTNASGFYFYAGGATPPAFTLPASNTLWGKYFFRLKINGGIKPEYVDDRTAVKLPAPNGTEDIGFLESNQFDPREGVGAIKHNLRLLEDVLDGVVSGGDAEVAPFSRLLYVDSSTAVATLDQDGSVSAPFATVQAAIDAAVAGTTIEIVRFSDGSHNLTIAKDITLRAARDEAGRPFGGQSRSGETVLVGTLTLTGSRAVGISGITTGAIGCSAGTSTLTIVDGASVGAITGAPVVLASFADLSGTIAASGEGRFLNCRFQVNGTIISTSGTVLELQSCRFTAGGNTIVFSGSAGTLYVDPVTYEYWLGVTETLTNGSLQVVGASLPTVDATLAYSGTTLQRGPLTGDITASTGSTTTAFRSFTACSVLGRSANSSGSAADIAAAANDRLFCRVADALQFSQLTAGMVPNNLVSDAMMRDSAALSVFGRAANSSGDPSDIVAAANDRFLRRVGNALDFGQLTSGMVPSNTIPLAGLVNITTDRLLGRDTAGSGATEEITVGGGLEFTGSGGIQRSGLTGDVTAPAGSNATTLANGAVDLVHLSTEVTDAIAAAGGAPPAAEYLVGALHGDLSAERLVTDTTTVAWDLATSGQAKANVPDGSLARTKLANGIACSVIGRVSNSTGQVQDIQAGANDRVLARSSDVVGFVQITRGMIQSGEIISTHIEADAVGNAALRNSGACSVIGRSANSSGDPADISAAANDRVFCRTGDALQFAQITGAMVAANTLGYGNLGQIPTDSLVGRDTAGTGNMETIGLDPTLEMSGSATLRRAALTGDVTASAGSNATTIPNNTVTNAKAADMAEATIKGRASGAGTGDPTDLTAAQVRTIINMVLSQVLAGGNTTGANNLGISAAQVLELIAGTPSTAGPANALIEFKREGGGTSSFIGIRTSGGLRYEGQDGVTIAAIGSTSHAEMSSGSAGRLALAGGSAGVIVTAQSGQVTIQDLRCLQYDTLSDQGNSDTAKTITWSYSGNTPSALQKLTLTDNCVLTFVNPEMPAYPLMLQIHQDASGGRAITWPATVKNAAALNSALSTTASTFSQVVLLWNGTFYTWQLVATGLTP